MGEWYLVAFRSVLRESADRGRLRKYDDRAHDEARSARGFVHYLKGPANDRGECLSFCLWTSRAHARAAAGRPAHREAVTVAHDTYALYTLEFLRLIKRAGGAPATPAAPRRGLIRPAGSPGGGRPAARPRGHRPAGPEDPARTRLDRTVDARTPRP